MALRNALGRFVKKTAAKKTPMLALAAPAQVITVESLIGKKDVALSVFNKNVPEMRETGSFYTDISAFEFPTNEIIVSQVTKDETKKNRFIINFLNPYPKAGQVRQTSVYINGDFQFHTPSPELEAKLMQIKEQWAYENLYLELYFNGKIGSDPEVFVETAKGALIPAFAFLPSKEKPILAAAPHTNSGANKTRNKLYWDGFQAEFDTQADHCMGWQADSIQAGLKGILVEARKHDKTSRLSMRTVFDIPPDMLANSAPEHVAFGCMPSLNAYGMEGKKGNGADIPYRTAGGHIHFGPDHRPKWREDADLIVKGLDAILGVACVALFAKLDDPRRREMYGLAGEYRLPPHGIEYRALSNAWLSHPVIANLVFDLARSAYVFAHKGLLAKYWKGDEKETISVMNSCDVAGAKAILERNSGIFKKIAGSRYGGNSVVGQWIFDACINGIESVIKDPLDIEGNWNLSGTWQTHSNGPGKYVASVAAKKSAKV